MEAVKNIGALQLEDMKEVGEGLLEVFTEDVSGGGNYKNAMEILIEHGDNKFSYKGINFREYDSDLKTKYLYRSGASRGTDVTPTAKITEVEKTFINKIIKAFPEAIEFGGEKYKEEKEILNGMQQVLIENKDLIKSDLIGKLKNVSKKEGTFITVCLVVNQEKKYVGDFTLFREKIVADALEKFRYSKTYDKYVFKDKAVCSLCGQNVEAIYGKVDVFPFYTIDKSGYISGGFDYEKAWRNYPVCKNCAIKLELGKNYLDENLVFLFYSRRYYLIPKPIYNNDLKNVLKKYRSLKSEDINDVRKKFSSTEERVMKILSKEQNSISFDLMFFEKDNAALDILLNIEDVAPSRFRTIFDALDEIRNMEFFDDKQVNFDLINYVFKKRKVGNKIVENMYFLDTIDKIISDRKIEYKFLMPFFNQYIMDSFVRYENDVIVKDEDIYPVATFRVFGFLYFLEYLNLLKHRKGDINMSIENKIWDIKDYDSKRDLFEAFYSEANPFFDSTDKKAVFLIGYVSKKLLNIQYAKEKRKPFLPRLKGLKLNKKDIKRLIPELQAKLIEYKSDFYNEEFNLISEYLIESNGLNSLSDLDIPMYFSLGMNMDKNFKTSAIDKITESYTVEEN